MERARKEQGLQRGRTRESAEGPALFAERWLATRLQRGRTRESAEGTYATITPIAFHALLQRGRTRESAEGCSAAFVSAPAMRLQRGRTRESAEGAFGEFSGGFAFVASTGPHS